jgi:hypothetical protein
MLQFATASRSGGELLEEAESALAVHFVAYAQTPLPPTARHAARFVRRVHPQRPSHDPEILSDYGPPVNTRPLAQTRRGRIQDDALEGNETWHIRGTRVPIGRAATQGGRRRSAAAAAERRHAVKS